MARRLSPVEKTSKDIVDYGRLAIVAMVVLATVYLVAQALVGMVPAIGLTILGIAGFVTYAINQKFRKTVNKWLKSK